MSSSHAGVGKSKGGSAQLSPANSFSFTTHVLYMCMRRCFCKVLHLSQHRSGDISVLRQGEAAGDHPVLGIHDARSAE